MKSKCPHCGFKFDTTEDITQGYNHDLKHNPRVRFVKSQIDIAISGGEFGYYELIPELQNKVSI